MFIITKKVHWRRLAAGAAAALVLAACFLTLSPGPAVSCGAADCPAETKGVRTNRDRLEFLASYGWEVDPQPVSTQTLTIPKELDGVYTQYIALQSSQGFDLTAYAGKRVKRYSYHVTNYPTGEQEVQVNLLVRRGRVVGGEVLSPRLDGFLHGLSGPED